MIDLKLLREDPDAVRRSQLSRGEDPALVDALLTADTDRRAAISAADSLRAEQKTASKSVGSASAEERPAKLARAKELAEQVKAAESAQAEAEAAFTAAHMAISNVILDPVPAGGEDDYAVLDVVGEPAAIESPKDHLELGESLGLIDMQRGAKVSGSRFYFLTGRGALLQLGLLQLAIRLAAGQMLDSAAAHCGISYETARKRLKVVFEKTDTCRQSELVALIIRIGTLAGAASVPTAETTRLPPALASGVIRLKQLSTA